MIIVMIMANTNLKEHVLPMNRDRGIPRIQILW